MAKIAPLCSSSKGNSVFVGNDRDGILIDCGCSFKMLKTSLEMCGIPFEAIRAIVITHEHSDHIKGLLQLLKHTELFAYASDGTTKKLIESDFSDLADRFLPLECLQNINSDINVTFFHTPHDSAESVGFRFDFSGHKVACCTDLGYVTDEVRNSLLGCDCVYIESNYDPLMLKSNPRYPIYLKERIAGKFGHLSNNDCSSFCSDLLKNGTTRLILGHLSPENNTPEVAYKSVYNRLLSDNAVYGRDYTLDVAKITTDGKYIAI